MNKMLDPDGQKTGGPKDLIADGFKTLSDKIAQNAEEQKAAQSEALEAIKSETAESIEGLKNEFGEKAKEINDRIDNLEVAKVPAKPEEETKTLGQIIHASDVYKTRWNTKNVGALVGSPGVKVPSLTSREGAKTTILGSAELSPLVIPKYRPGVFEDAHEEFGLVDLIARIPAPATESVIVRKETRASHYGYVHTQSTNAVGGVATPTNEIVVDSTDGFVGGTYCRIWTTATGMERELIVSVDVGNSKLVFGTDEIDFDIAEGDSITSEVYGATAESATKPYAYAEFETVNETMKTLAILMGITKQRLNSAPMFDAWARRVLVERAKRVLSWHLMYGDDANAGELAGFASESGVQTYAWSGGAVGDTRADAVLKAALLIAGDPTCTLVLNKRDWTNIYLEKATDGHYINTKTGPTMILDGGPGRRYLGSYPVIIDDAIIDGDFLLLDPRRASELYDQQSSEILVGYVDDQFARNELTLRYDETLLHAIMSVYSYVHGEFDGAPT